MSNITYDIIKWIVCLVLPAVATLIIGLSKIWPIPYAAEIAATITLVDTFLGTIMQISSANYRKEINNDKK